MAELEDAPASEAGDESHESSRLSWGTNQFIRKFRVVAQLAARLLWEHQVADSISAAPTTQERDRAIHIVLSWKPASKIGRRRNS